MFTQSCGEVKRRLDRRLIQRLPTIDPAHGDLPRRHQRPEQHGRRFRVGQQDTALFPTIWEKELPGVLTRALDGLKRLYERGEKFDPPKDCIAAKQDFFTQANPLVCFLSEQCENNPDGRIRLMDLRIAIKAWASEQGLKSPMIADKALRRKLIGLGYKVSKVKGYATLFGVVLKMP